VDEISLVKIINDGKDLWLNKVFQPVFITTPCPKKN